MNTNQNALREYGKPLSPEQIRQLQTENDTAQVRPAVLSVINEATLLKLLQEHDVGEVRALIQTMQGRDAAPHFKPEPNPEPMNWPHAVVRVVDLVCDLLFWSAVMTGAYLLLTR